MTRKMPRPKLPIEIAATVQQAGDTREEQEITDLGFEPYSQEAMPFYTARARSDIKLSAALLGIIANDVRVLATCAKLIVGLLILIFLGLLFGRFK
jgi:hypothetical protein